MESAVQRMGDGGREGDVVNDEVAPYSGMRPGGITDRMETSLSCLVEEQ